MTLSAQSTLDQLVISWIQNAKPSIDADEIKSSDLIESRTLDSMQFLDFVYFMNELCDSDITSEITVDDMRTLPRIVAFVASHAESQQSKWRLAS